MSDSIHDAVMPEEALHWLAPQPGQTIVDGTLGGGGHTRRFLDAVGSDGLVIAIDRDPLALERAEKELAGRNLVVAHANFCDASEVLAQLDIAHVDGILLDLGLSSDQLADDTRGFSFHAAGPLDLRFDPSSGIPCWQWLERVTEKDLANAIYRYGEERHSRRIARALVAARQRQTLRSAETIAEIIRRAIPGTRGKIDPATRTFQALRIAINDELRSLELALERIPRCLNIGGRLGIISFHSLEDRIVKVAFREMAGFETITRKPVRPSEEEVGRNPRSRSARFRVAERQS